MTMTDRSTYILQVSTYVPTFLLLLLLLVTRNFKRFTHRYLATTSSNVISATALERTGTH